MDIKKRYLQMEPGNFCLPPPETRKSDLTKDGVYVTTMDKLEKGGSAGTVIFKEPYRNILEINCIDADCPLASMCICLPEIAPYGVWEQYPYEQSLRRGWTNDAMTSLATYDTKPEKLPKEFDKNWFPVNVRVNTAGQNSGSGTFNPIPVARREKSQPPFHLDKLTMLAFVVQNNKNPSYQGPLAGSGSITGAGDVSRPQGRYTWFDNSTFNSSASGPPYDSFAMQQQFCFEIIMLDETPHIARMPNADGYFEEYEDEFNVTGRQRRLAKDFNRALASRKKFLV